MEKENNNGKNDNAIPPEFLKEMEIRLKRMFGDASAVEHYLEEEDREELPQDSEDALPMRVDREVKDYEESIEEDKKILIEHALKRIEEGTYGFCRACAKAIPLERLEATPYIENCVPCQEIKEKDKKKHA